MDFRSRIFSGGHRLTIPEAQRAIEARGGNLETLKRRAVSAYLRRTYDEKRKRGPGAIVRPPVADRPAEG